MSAWSDPPRLLEGSALSDEDRSALSAYAAEGPGLERRARMFEGLARELGPQAGSAGAGSTVRWSAGKLKLALSVAGLLASAIGLMMLWPRHAAPPSARTPHTLQVAAKPAPRAVPEAAAEALALVPQLPASSTPAAPPVVAAPSTLPAAAAQHERNRPKRLRDEPSAPASSDLHTRVRGPAQSASLGLDPLPVGPESLDRRSDPVAELALLARARRALLTRPAQSLEFTEKHAREFPHGTFGEEREVLAIEALLRLGLDDEAKQRAIAFERHFPNSAHRAHLARMIRPLDP